MKEEIQIKIDTPEEAIEYVRQNGWVYVNGEPMPTCAIILAGEVVRLMEVNKELDLKYRTAQAHVR